MVPLQVIFWLMEHELWNIGCFEAKNMLIFILWWHTGQDDITWYATNKHTIRNTVQIPHKMNTSDFILKQKLKQHTKKNKQNKSSMVWKGVSRSKSYISLRLSHFSSFNLCVILIVISTNIQTTNPSLFTTQSNKYITVYLQSKYPLSARKTPNTTFPLPSTCQKMN